MQELNHVFVSSSIQVQTNCGLLSLYISHNEGGSLTNKAEELLLHTLKEFDGTCQHFVFPVVVKHNEYNYTSIKVKFLGKENLSITNAVPWWGNQPHHGWEVIVDKQTLINNLEKLLSVA